MAQSVYVTPPDVDRMLEDRAHALTPSGADDAVQGWMRAVASEASSG
jgi:hypothetical protein